MSGEPAPTAAVILFKPGGKYYTEEQWEVPTREQVVAAGGSPGDSVGPFCMAYSPDFRQIDGGPVLVDTQEPWGYPFLLGMGRPTSPLYVNHDRTEPVAGDVVRRDVAAGALACCWIWDGERECYGWHETSSDTWWGPERPWPAIRLLVDGATGHVVPQ